MNDPFEPDWSVAPAAAQWHVVHSTGDGAWVEDTEEIGIRVVDAEPYWYMEWAIDTVERYSRHYNVVDYDWRNSLRHRPAQ